MFILSKIYQKIGTNSPVFPIPNGIQKETTVNGLPRMYLQKHSSKTNVRWNYCTI